jgi:hypothetical protein
LNLTLRTLPNRKSDPRAGKQRGDRVSPMKALHCRVTGHRHHTDRIGANLFRIVCSNCSMVSFVAAPRGREGKSDQVLTAVQ